MLDRREWLAATLGALVAGFTGSRGGAATRQTIRVHKNPGCGCCDKWAEHVRAAGFEVVVEEDPALDEFRNRLGVPAGLRSCHTGLLGDYVVEGHVPADLIRRMVDEKPAIAGIAVPGMPMGSPGMEGPSSQRYQVLAFRKDGRTSVYATR